MKLSFRIVADPKDLHDLSHPYKDLTELIRRAQKDSPLETPEALEAFCREGNRLTVAYYGITIVGRATLSFEVIGGVLSARIDDVIMLPGYEDENPKIRLIFPLMVFAKYAFNNHGLFAHHVDVVRHPGIFKRTIFRPASGPNPET
jgi:hypothetical protein